MKFFIITVALSLLYTSNADTSLKTKSLLELEQERQAAADDCDGKTISIKPKAIIHTFDAFNRISGYDFNFSRIANRVIRCQPPVKMAFDMYNGAVIGFYYVDFGLGARSIHLRYSNGSPESRYPFNVIMYLDEPHRGRPLANFNLMRTGHWCTWSEVTINLDIVPKGIRSVYFVSNVESSPQVGVMTLDWFRFFNNRKCSTCQLSSLS